MKKALVFGGSGQMARALVPVLAEKGWVVEVVTRAGRPLPQVLEGYCRQVPSLENRAAMIGAGGGYDAVFDPMVLTPAEARDLLVAAEDVGQFCVISTASVYADAEGRALETAGETGFPRFPRQITEAQPVIASGSGYSAGKVAMEAVLAEARVTVLRPGAIHGVGARHPREWWFVKRALDGRSKVPLIDRGQNIFQTSSAAGIASLAAFCLQNEHLGVFNVADPQALSVAQIGQAVFEAMGHQAQLISADDLPDADWHVGMTPWSVEHPMRLSTAKARALGWDGGPDFASQMPALCNWLAGHTGSWQTDFPAFSSYGYDSFDYAAEDAALR